MSLNSTIFAAIAILTAGLLGCVSGQEIQVDENTDSDIDTDSDSDTDTDTDTDADTDADTDTDIDTDNDGLSDEMEEDIGTDPNNEDTDGDGVTDLVEWVAGTDPNDPNSNPAAEGNFYFLMPYVDSPDPTEDTLNFATDIQKADLFFLIDTTSSMGDEIDNLKSSLSSYIIPEVNDIIPDIWFGLGRFDDYSQTGYGGGDDEVFRLVQRMTSSTPDAQTAVDSLDIHWGWDLPESHVPALYATATGVGFETWLDPQTSCGPDEFGYPCFRNGAVPIVMLITDAPFHNGPDDYEPYSDITPVPPIYNETVVALNDVHIKVITVRSDDNDIALTHCTAITTDTGTLDADDNPLVFSVDEDGTGLDESIVQAVQTIANNVPMDISTEDRDDPSDSEDATVFIDYITPYNVNTAECTGGLTTSDLDADGIDDIFLDVNPGWPVCFDVIPKMNNSVPEILAPQLFKAYIDVIGDTITVLDTRTIFFLVPPSEPIGPV